MRIISERRIREFCEEHKASETAFRDWILVVRKADWGSFSDVRKTFNHSDVHRGMTIFDVGGNKYRVISKIEYQKHVVFLKHVMTHDEYDRHYKWCDCGL